MSDSERLTERSVRRLTEELASRAPTPGGGSASAVVGAMGAALVAMVVELSIGRPELGAHSAELRRIGMAAAAWQSELLNLAELDAIAYQAVLRARRLPRGTPEERLARAVQAATATREATRVPLRTAEVAAEVLSLTAAVAPIGSPNAISDAGVAAHLASAAVHGAALNVRINLPFLPHDEPLRTEAQAQLAALLPGAHDRQRATLATVNERMEASPSR